MNPNRSQLFQFTIAGVVAITLGLFIHDSGATVLQVIRIAGRALFLPLLLAGVLTYILDPAISALERQGVRRGYGVLFVYALLLAGLSAMTFLVLPFALSEWAEFRNAIPKYASRIIQVFAGVDTYMEKTLKVFASGGLSDTLSSSLNSSSQKILSITVGSIRTLVSLCILVPIFSFFFLYDGRRMKRAFVRNIPNRYFESTMIVLHQIDDSLGRFIQGRFYESAIVGFIALVGLYLVGLKFFWIFALFVAVTNLVPVFGPLFGMLITITFAYLDNLNLWFPILVFFVLLFGQIVDNLFLIPVLIKRTTSVHVVTGIIAILIGGQLFGVVGMIIAVPVASIFKIVFQETWRHWRDVMNAHSSLEIS